MVCMNRSNKDIKRMIDKLGENLAAYWLNRNNGVPLTDEEIEEIKNDKQGDKPKEMVYYQNNSGQSNEEFIASEKTIRDLAARLANRIGIEVKFISDRSQNFKGKLEGNVASINLAYATLDTIFHEVSGHAIIATLKQKSETSVKNHIQDLIEKGVIIKEC